MKNLSMAHHASHLKRNIITLVGEPSWRRDEENRPKPDNRSWTQKIADETRELFGCSMVEQKKREAQFGGE